MTFNNRARKVDGVNIRPVTAVARPATAFQMNLYMQDHALRLKIYETINNCSPNYAAKMMGQDIIVVMPTTSREVAKTWRSEIIGIVEGVVALANLPFVLESIVPR